MAERSNSGVSKLIFWILGALLSLNLLLVGVAARQITSSIDENKKAITSVGNKIQSLREDLVTSQWFDSLLVRDVRDCEIRIKALEDE